MWGFILLLLIIILIIYRLFFTIWKPLLPLKLFESTFFYYAHRGAPEFAPENTIESFKFAINNHIDGIELDIQLTSDNYLIVYHDRDVTYNNTLTKITSLNLNEIHTIDVKNNFEDMPFQKIPTLNDVVDILPKNIILNIEIKSYNSIFPKGIEKPLIQLIHNKSIANQIVISSFNPFIINKIKKINPNLSTAFIWSKKSIYNYKLWSYYSKPDAFHVNINDIDQNMIDWFTKKNIRIYAYTINSDKQLEKAKQYNVNGIFTDNPKIKANVPS